MIVIIVQNLFELIHYLLVASLVVTIVSLTHVLFWCFPPIRDKREKEREGERACTNHHDNNIIPFHAPVLKS